MNDQVDWIWRLAATPWMPWLLSVLILLFAIGTWLDFRLRMARVIRGLDRAIAAVTQVDGPTAFRQRYAAIFEDIAKNPVLGETWRAYATTLAPMPANEQAIGYTRPPDDALNESIVARAGINLRYYAAVPNFLVGSGLLFSFIGLVSALYIARDGVLGGTIEETQTALGQLLGAATFKFATSIAGLFASIVFSWAEKRQLYELHHRLHRLCDALAARMVPVTTESLMLAQLERTRSIEHQLTRLSRSVYVRVPDALENTLAHELHTAIQPLRKAIERAGTQFNDSVPHLISETSAQLAQAATQSAPPGNGASGTAESVSDHAPRRRSRFEELVDVADRRLRSVLEITNRGLEVIQSGRSESLRAREGRVSELLSVTHSRVRECRQAMVAVREQLANDTLSPADAADVLSEIDYALAETRQVLQQAAERDTPGGGRR